MPPHPHTPPPSGILEHCDVHRQGDCPSEPDLGTRALESRAALAESSSERFSENEKDAVCRGRSKGGGAVQGRPLEQRVAPANMQKGPRLYKQKERE